MRTARLSTSGGFEASACARAICELLAKVPISAVTKPAPPAHSSPRRDIEKAAGRQLHAPNNMSKLSDLVRLAVLGFRCVCSHHWPDCPAGVQCIKCRILIKIRHKQDEL